MQSFIPRRGDSFGRLGRLGAMLFALCAAILLLAPGANAQVTGQGTLSGTVTDSTGSILVDAQVTVTNSETNVSQTSTTNSTGYFEVDNLNPGSYSIQVVSQGFETLLREGITLQADARLNVPMKLHPGAVRQTVTVSADASLLNTESASTGEVLSTREVEELTYSGSNPTWLELIAPGTQSNISQSYSFGDGGGLIWVGMTQNFGNFGQIGKNEFSLDGAPNESTGAAEGMNSAPDAVGEMKMDVTGYDASIGHTLGVNITTTTKGGTNVIHGAARWTYSDTRWQALSHFGGLNYRYQQSLANCDNGPTTSPQCYAIENKYGNDGTNANNGDANIGGPVYIPHIFDGRNKFFFFVSGIIDNFAGVQTQSATVPTTQELTGNFGDYNGIDPNALKNTPANWNTAVGSTPAQCPGGQPYFGQYQIYNPFTVTLTGKNGAPQRQPFCGDQVPVGLQTNSLMTKFYNGLVPAPNSGGLAASNYAYSVLTPQTFRDWTTREDWKISAKDSFWVRYTWQRYTKGTNSIFGSIGNEKEARWPQDGTVGWNHIFSSGPILKSPTAVRTSRTYAATIRALTRSIRSRSACLLTQTPMLRRLPAGSITNCPRLGSPVIPVSEPPITR